VKFIVSNLIAFILMFASTVSNAEIVEFNLPTAADGDVIFKVNKDSRLPIPVSDERCEVLVAGLAITKEKNGRPQLEWQYTLKFNTDVAVESIIIEDEKSDNLVTSIHDDDPEISNGLWNGKEHFTELTKDIFDLMYKEDTWLLLQRITVQYEDGFESKLHQMIIQTQKSRHDLITRTADIMKSR